MTLILRSLAVTCLLGITAGCSYNTSPSSELYTLNTQAIIAGTPSDSEDPIRAASVVVNLASGYTCSGVLLNDHVVLTAAHCVNHGESIPAKSVVIPSADKSCFSSTVAEVALAPKLAGHSFAPDFALLKLTHSVCTPPSVVLEATPAVNTLVTATGFGNGSSLNVDLMDMKVISSDLESLHKLYEDDRDGSVQANWNYIEANYDEFSEMYLFTLAQNNEQSLCFGDSGGPVYRTENGALHIYGTVGGGFPHAIKGVHACQDTYLQLFAPIGPSLNWLHQQLKKW